MPNAEASPSGAGFSLPRVLLCGANRGAGVSTICFGLVVSYTRMHLGVGSASLGTSLIEPTHYRRIANRLSYTLDPRILSAASVVAGMRRLSDGTELAIIEGSGGLFDELGPESSYPTNAAFAIATKTPVVLVIEASGYGESIAALLTGYKEFRKDLPLVGVILNRVPNKEQADRLKRAIEGVGGLQYLGSVRQGDPHQMGATLASYRAHNPSALTRNRVIGTGNLIKEGVDLDALRKLGEAAEPVPDITPVPGFISRRARVAVADDQAFHLTVQDNLDLLRRAGAELVPFSPIADQALPKNCQAVYFPGGYPHLYAADLQANQPIRRSIKQYVESGGRLYAEAGALAYLSRRLTTFQGVSYDMVGAFPAQASAVFADDIQPVLPVETLDSTRHTLLGKTPIRMRALRDTRWQYRIEGQMPSCFERIDSEASKSSLDVVKVPESYSPYPDVVLSRCYMHWGSHPESATTLVDSVVGPASAAVK